MNIKEAIKMCVEDTGYNCCEECGVFENSECWKYLSQYLLKECSSCRNNKYYCVNGNEIEKVVSNFCPECGRAL